MSKLYNILLVHNKYQYYGGEDSVVDDELKLLEANGHSVKLYIRDNAEIDTLNSFKVLLNSIWSRRTTHDLDSLIKNSKPDIIHIHNTFPLISPSIYWAANKHNIPIIQTIHNFRLSCMQAMFLRNMKVCEDCLNKTPWRGVLRKCYRSSFLASTSAAVILSLHRLIGTYQNKITTFIALNNFCKRKIIEMGLPKEKIMIKPNFVTLEYSKCQKRNGNPLFVGRLSEEKGVSILKNLIKSIPGQVFDIVGDGPLKDSLQNIPNARLLGLVDQAGVYELMQNAPFLMLPSIWYENMPRTLVEAYGNGVPVIASRIGALEELVVHRKTGILFDTGSVESFKEAVVWALQNPNEMNKMGMSAHNMYKMEYSSKANYKILMEIYNKAIERTRL
jgi:glycosyltransferase involved in cell wall biosynthesis